MWKQSLQNSLTPLLGKSRPMLHPQWWCQGLGPGAQKNTSDPLGPPWDHRIHISTKLGKWAGLPRYQVGLDICIHALKNMFPTTLTCRTSCMLLNSPIDFSIGLQISVSSLPLGVPHPSFTPGQGEFKLKLHGQLWSLWSHIDFNEGTGQHSCTQYPHPWISMAYSP